MAKADPVQAFLHFGYLPDDSSDPLAFLGDSQGWSIQKRNLAGKSLSFLVELGVERLKTAFSETMVGGNGRIHVLPLSGGLDSRAILGGLLENVGSHQIQTVTYGSPGAWDYELGRRVAQAAGVPHQAVDLTAVSWHWSAADILATAVQVAKPVWLIDTYINHHILKRYGAESSYWSGFMGDPLAGSHLLPEDSASWSEARRRFVTRNRYTRSVALTSSHYDPVAIMPGQPWLQPELLTYDEQLDFGLRQRCLIRHIITLPGYACRMPFLHSEWVAFMLGTPREYRAGQFLYKKILQAAYPHLFSLPTKTNKGLPLDAPSWRQQMQRIRLQARAGFRRLLPRSIRPARPNVNYIDFNGGLRRRADLKSFVHEHIQQLKGRDLVKWVDIDKLWRQHQQGGANYAPELLLLAYLDIYLSAGKLAQHVAEI